MVYEQSTFIPALPEIWNEITFPLKQDQRPIAFGLLVLGGRSIAFGLPVLGGRCLH
jgi:hypothetical protein